MKATRAIQFLVDRKIPHQVRAYEADGFVSAVEGAKKLGIPANSMFKTLVARGERRGIVLAVLPGDEKLSLRKLAQAMGDKRAELVDTSEITRLTGFVKGGVSPLGGKLPYPVYMDSTALRHPTIFVSAGLRGLAIQIAPSDLVEATRATVLDILE